MTIGALGLAFVAGLLSVLSPCVLPLLPLVFGAAASESRAGPVALAAGVALAFTAIGLFVATVGFAIGLDGAAFRIAAAVLMIGVGALLIAPAAQTRLATAGGPVTAWANARIDGISSHGAFGQFGVGLLLGAAWSPCVGPTLGAASGARRARVFARVRCADHARVRDRRSRAARRDRACFPAGDGALAGRADAGRQARQRRARRPARGARAPHRQRTRQAGRNRARRRFAASG